MDVPCDTANANAVVEMMSKLDIWYGDTPQDVREYALEETLWMQMLLRHFKGNGCSGMSVMLNPRKVGISEPEQEDCIIGFITSIAGNEYGSAYKALRRDIQVIQSAWEVAGKPLDFQYAIEV